MIQAANFRLVQARAVVFTPGLQFRAARVLPGLLTTFGELFDSEPHVLTLPGPEELPRVTLNSSDGRWTLLAAPARLDIFRRGVGTETVSLLDFLSQALQIFSLYEEASQARVGRLACVLTRLVLEAEAAKVVAEHFCREEWLRRPLNRPTDFELHAAKQFDLLPGLKINSWFRCRAGNARVADHPPQPGVSVEQDFNTLAEESDNRDFTGAAKEDFFRAAPAEFDRVLDLYFPREPES